MGVEMGVFQGCETPGTGTHFPQGQGRHIRRYPHNWKKYGETRNTICQNLDHGTVVSGAVRRPFAAKQARWVDVTGTASANLFSSACRRAGEPASREGTKKNTYV